MLLRRVIQHVTEQNWTAVVIDFLIVVLGVFMGIQVQGWYENQRDKRLITDYLHRLNDDFSLYHRNPAHPRLRQLESP